MIDIPGIVWRIFLLSHGILLVRGAGLEFIVAETTLPSSRRMHAVVYDGQDYIYIIGGYKDGEEDSDASEVLRYSVESGHVDVVGNFLNISSGAALMHGDDIIYFGGYLESECIYSSAVYSYSTIDHRFKVVGHLPRAMDSFTVAWDPTKQVAYLFGGCDGPVNSRNCYDKVHNYNAITHEIEANIAQLPGPRFGAPAVWDFSLDTELIYVFGGHVHGVRDDILQYNTSSSQAHKLSTQLPSENSYLFAVYADIDQHMYIVGYENLIRFNPANSRVDTMAVNAWPMFIRCTAGVYVPKLDRLYIFGGSGVLSNTSSDESSFSEIFYVEIDASLPIGTTASQESTTESTTPEPIPEATSPAPASETSPESTSPESTTESVITTPRRDSRALLYTLLVGIPFIIMLMVYMIYTCNRHRNLKHTHGGSHTVKPILLVLSPIEILEFHEGASPSDSPSPNRDLYITRRNVIYHRYDLLFELAEDKVRVYWSIVLGYGEFGIVLQGKLLETGALVAVKTLKPDCSDKSYLKALLSEIKILIYVGRHPHIVNLVGAQTKMLNHGKVFLFVEYCPMGDLKKYLEKRKNDCFDCFSDNGGQESQSVIPSHYVPAANLSICLCNLYQWSVQIASAMEYLTARNVVHGDVAARNVLLVDTQCVKLTDFGLAKHLTKSTYWSSGTRVPWQNAAIESLREVSFSIQSDVWSFGVTLWEIFSLGDTPYETFSRFSYDFLRHLEEGYRLPEPQYASKELYVELLKCWTPRPEERPTIAELKETLEAMERECNAKHLSHGRRLGT